MAIGMDDSNEAWPWLSLTEYGEDVARAAQPVPHDAAGFITNVEFARPLSDVERRYVVQAVEAYNRNLPDAAAIMIGAASESLLEELVEAIGKQDPAEPAAANTALAGPGAALMKFAHSYVTGKKANLARPLREQLDTTFLGVANLIRIARNDAGHPSLASVSRDQALVNLQLYPIYRSWILEVIGQLPL